MVEPDVWGRVQLSGQTYDKELLFMYQNRQPRSSCSLSPSWRWNHPGYLHQPHHTWMGWGGGSNEAFLGAPYKWLKNQWVCRGFIGVAVEFLHPTCKLVVPAHFLDYRSVSSFFSGWTCSGIFRENIWYTRHFWHWDPKHISWQMLWNCDKMQKIASNLRKSKFALSIIAEIT